jgi:NADH-quinone oxidoreductase subunit F
MEKFLLRNVGVPNSHEIDVYIERGGYQALAKALKEFEPRELVNLVRESGLRGRGGAGFPAGVKWSFLPKGVYPRYLVCNADGEYVFGAERLEKTVAQAYERGYLGQNILGSGYDLELTVHRGAGSYVCGEETGLLTSLEGDRGHPKLKPPFPASQGLYRKPTIINNVETLFNVPFIVEHGAEWYKGFGTERSPGLKLFCISGHVNKPGVYELPLGTPMMTLINDYAGGPSRPIKTVIPGGSSTPMLPPDVLDTLTLDYEALATAGSMLGSGAVIVVGEGTCIVRLVERLAEFYRHESCGKCIPCREGTDWLYKIMHRIEHGQGREEDIDLLLDICDNIGGKSFCPLGDAALGPITSSIKHFRDEYLYHIREKQCMV